MARIKVGAEVVVDNLSAEAGKGAMHEIGLDRLRLARGGDAKALQEIKAIGAKWAKKHPCKPGCDPKAGAAGQSTAPAAAQSAAARKREAEPKSGAKPTTPKAAQAKTAKPKSPKPKVTKPKTTKPKVTKPKATKAAKPKSERKPKSGAGPKSEGKPKSESKPGSKAKPTGTPPAKASKGKKAPNVTKEKIKDLTAKLTHELKELRVICPPEKARLVDTAVELLATAKAVAKFSPEARKAHDELKAALEGFVGYAEAKAAVAAAEKSLPVRQAKDHVKEVRAEQISERDRQILEDAEKDPRVVAAREAVKEARTPDAVKKAQEDLQAARQMCQRSARTLRETYGEVITKLRDDMAKDPPVVSEEPIVVPTAEQLLFGPRTVASARMS